MRKLFAAGVIGVIILEIALVYFIMPLPGSQRQPVVLALAADTTSFFAFVRPDAQTRFSLRGDSLVADGRRTR